MKFAKILRISASATVLLCFGVMVPSYAQHDGQGDKQAKPESQGKSGQQQPQRAQQPQQQQPQRAQQPQQQQQRAQQPQQQQPQRAQQPQQQQPQRAQQPQQQPQTQRAQQPQQQPQQQQRAQQPPQQQQPERTQQQAQSWQQQRGWLQKGGWQGQATFQQDRSQHWSSDHRTWSQRGGYGGYYIPQQTFGLYFGIQHFFRLGTLPVMYLGYPRFQYGGFTFLMLDPWPEDWGPTWYATDDVYVGYDDGYYLYNRMHPGEAVAITILV